MEPRDGSSAGGASDGMALRPANPLEWLDRAASMLRAADARQLVRAWTGGAPLAWMILLIYYMESIEGVRELRPAFAVGLACALVFRGLRLGAVSRGFVELLRPELVADDGTSRWAWRVASVSLQGSGLVFWGCLAWIAARISPYALAVLIPVFAIRGAVAPAWSARVGCTREQGWRAFGQALDDARGIRAEMYTLELLTLFGLAGLLVNLAGLISLALAIAHSMFGLEVALLSAFMDPDNPLLLLLLLVLTCMLLEPLRAALSALAFVDARTRRDGADLEAAVDAAIAPAAPPHYLMVVLPPLLLGVLYSLTPAAAAADQHRELAGGVEATGQPAHVGGDEGGIVPDRSRRGPVREPMDETVRDDVRRILAAPAFREFADDRERPFARFLGEQLRRLSEWLASLGEGTEMDADPTLVELPAPPIWLLVTLSVALLVVTTWLLRKPAVARQVSEVPTVGMPSVPTKRMDDAEALSARGEHRLALRALYLATLARLDAARLIEYDPSATNWQYLRQLPKGEVREVFREFTLAFDRKWYGREVARAEDYRRCRAFADEVAARLRGPVDPGGLTLPVGAAGR